MLKVVLFVAALCAVLQVADARLFKGSIKTKNDWQYVAKFCFNGKVGGTKGTVAWNIPSPSNPHRQLLMYWDQPDKGKQGSWTNVYKNKGLTCAQKSSVNDTAAGGIVNLHDVPSGVKHPGNSYNHYWWLVVADCGAASQTIPSYSIQFTQENGSQMSCDEEGLPAMYIVFFVFYLFVIVAHAYSAWQLFKSEALHPIVRIISVALALQFFSIFFEMIHYTTLKRNGVGVEGLKAFGDLLNMLMDLAIILLMVLISKGWAVTTNVIPKRDTTIILVVMALLIVLYLALFIWDYATADSAIIYYFYQSVPGVMILVIRALVGFWFLWNIFQTLKLETLPEKRGFYVRWAIIFGSWIALLPLVVLIFGSQHVWMRLKAISAISELIDFAMLVILVIHTWPSLARRYFSVMPGKTLLGYDFLSGEQSVYAGQRNPVPSGEARDGTNPFTQTSEL
jgi:hypothetical protein